MWQTKSWLVQWIWRITTAMRTSCARSLADYHSNLTMRVRPAPRGLKLRPKYWSNSRIYFSQKVALVNALMILTFHNTFLFLAECYVQYAVIQWIRAYKRKSGCAANFLSFAQLAKMKVQAVVNPRLIPSTSTATHCVECFYYIQALLNCLLQK